MTKFKVYIKKYLILILIFICFSLLKNIKEKLPKISVFLPIYNKDKYIKRCIESIQRQSLKNIEIVAVNDNSNDETLNILIDYSKNDSRIKIVNNDKNHGLLYSRAIGILNSSGKYIMNVDPDDELSNNDSLEFLYNQTIITNADIISFDIYDERLKKIIKCKNNNIIQNQPLLFESIFKKNNRINDFLIWNKLIRREIFIKAFHFFQKEIYNYKWNYFEDDIWNILVNKYATSKLCANKLIYIYHKNPDSLISKRFGLIEFQNLLYRHEMYKKLFTKKKEEKYLIAEHYFLLNRLKWERKYLLLINDTNIKKNITTIFQLFMKHYKCSKRQKRNINNFIKLIS